MKLFVVAHACVVPVNREIYRMLAQKGYQVNILIPQDYAPTRPFIQEADDCGVVMHERPQIGRGQRFHSYDGLIELLEECQPDIVLLDLEPDSRLAAVLAQWCRKSGVRLFIQTCENLSMSETIAGRGLLARLGHCILRNVFLRSARSAVSGLFPIAQGGARLLEAMGFSPEKITQIPLGVNNQQFQSVAELRLSTRERLGVDADDFAFAYFGRVVPEKGLDRLIEALTGLEENSFWLLLDMPEIAETDYQRAIRDLLKRSGVLPRVKFFEAEHHEMQNYYNAADCVVVPSVGKPGFIEQYGRVVCEALASETLVAVSDNGALAEVAGGSGFVFRADDVDSLTVCLREILSLDTDDRGARVKAGRLRAEQEIGLEQQLKIMQTAFSASLG